MTSVMKRDRVVTTSAMELSIGITKLSGSKPLLWVDAATVKEIIDMTATAIMFTIKRVLVSL